MIVKWQKLLAVGMALGVVGLPLCARAQDDAAKKDEVVVDEAAEKEVADKLVKLTTMEAAFKKALRTVNLLNRYIAQENAKLKGTEDEEAQKEIRKNIGAARKRLQTLSTAMDVVFGIGRRRTYQYDEVTSTVYLRVGTVEEAFARVYRTRAVLQGAAAKLKPLIEAEQDAEKKKELETRLANVTRSWQTVAAAMQMIYGVAPSRNYEYDPKASTLYLKVTDTELEKLKAQLAELQEKQAEKAEGEKKAE